MESAWSFQLNLVEWQLFLHLSFAALTPSFNKRKAKCEELCWKMATLHRLHIHDLAFVIRFEDGERTGRPHCHAVLAGLPTRGTDVKSRLVYKAWANRLMGNAHVNAFLPSLPGVSYITDGLSHYDAGTAYEVAKFGTADAIYVNPKARMEFLRARAFGIRRS